MNDIEYVTESTVTLYKSNASDLDVARAAWVSQNIEAHEKEAEEGRVAGLIDFLWRNGHHSPFEHGQFTFVIETPIFVAREFFRHRTCVTGDTVIRFCSPNNVTESRHRPIEQAWENMHLGVRDNRTRSGGKIRFRKRTNDYVIDVSGWDEATQTRTTQVRGPFTTLDEAKVAHEGLMVPWRRRKLASVRNLHAVSIDENTGFAVSNRVLDIVKQGVKPVYVVRTEDGDSVKATADHRFRTPSGYVELKDLSVGDSVQVVGSRGVSTRNPLVSKELRQGIGHWTQVVKQTQYSKTDRHLCYMCSTSLAWNEMHLDHVEPVVLNLTRALDATNLAPVCHACHKVKTASEQRYRSRGRTQAAGAVSVRVTSIEPAGEEMTYDMVMEAPNHNFIGSNFVLHNCSFSETSGRYTELKPRFYVPAPDRPMRQEGKVGNYTFVPDGELSTDHVIPHIEMNSRQSWNGYQALLERGVAKEVARMVLPVNTMTTFWATVNPRNLMHFLDLRVDSQAQYEIQDVARQMEKIFSEQMPLTYAAWQKSSD